jgi:hypothetical protein
VRVFPAAAKPHAPRTTRLKATSEVTRRAPDGDRRMLLMWKRKDGACVKRRLTARRLNIVWHAKRLDSIHYKDNKVGAENETQNAASARIMPWRFAA